MSSVFALSQNVNKDRLLADLRQKVNKLEGFSQNHDRKPFQIGVAEIDHSLRGGLAAANTHECMATNAAGQAATAGFLAALLGPNISGAVIWITQRMPLNPAGLRLFNMPPEKILVVQTRRDKEALWAMEEALRTCGVGAVVTEVGVANLTATRRLQLAAEQGGVIGFLLRTCEGGASSCLTRWRIAPVPGVDDSLPGLGYPAWQVRLERMRGGHAKEWQLAWRDGQFVSVKPPVPDYALKKIAL